MHFKSGDPRYAGCHGLVVSTYFFIIIFSSILCGITSGAWLGESCTGRRLTDSDGQSMAISGVVIFFVAILAIAHGLLDLLLFIAHCVHPVYLILRSFISIALWTTWATLAVMTMGRELKENRWLTSDDGGIHDRYAEMSSAKISFCENVGKGWVALIALMLVGYLILFCVGWIGCVKRKKLAAESVPATTTTSRGTEEEGKK